MLIKIINIYFLLLLFQLHFVVGQAKTNCDEPIRVHYPPIYKAAMPVGTVFGIHVYSKNNHTYCGMLPSGVDVLYEGNYKKRIVMEAVKKYKRVLESKIGHVFVFWNNSVSVGWDEKQPCCVEVYSDIWMNNCKAIIYFSKNKGKYNSVNMDLDISKFKDIRNRCDLEKRLSQYVYESIILNMTIETTIKK